MAWKAPSGISGCRTRLCGTSISCSRSDRDRRTKTSFDRSMTPLASVVEKKISSTPTSWTAPVGVLAGMLPVLPVLVVVTGRGSSLAVPPAERPGTDIGHEARIRSRDPRPRVAPIITEMQSLYGVDLQHVFDLLHYFALRDGCPLPLPARGPTAIPLPCGPFPPVPRPPAVDRPPPGRSRGRDHERQATDWDSPRSATAARVYATALRIEPHRRRSTSHRADGRRLRYPAVHDSSP